MSRSSESTSASSSSPRSEQGRLEFGALDRLAGYQLRRAHTRFFADFRERLSQFAITPGQLGILLMIEGNAGISQTALARAMRIERSTLGEFIDRFEERKLVERRGSIVDRRSHALHLTPDGNVFMKAVMPTVEAHEETVLRALSATDRATLVRLLAQIAGD